MELSFRNATVDDVEDLVRLINSAYRGESARQGWTCEADLLDGQRTDAAMLREVIQSPAGTILLAEAGVFVDDRSLVGCCELAREGRVGYLGMVTIDPARQGAGLGRRLIAEAERRSAQTWGVTSLRMTVIGVRSELIAFYGRLGYEPTGRREAFPYGNDRFGVPRREDLDFIELAKSLAD